MRREVCRAALRVAASSWSAQGSSCVGGIKFEHRMVENVSLLHFCGISMRERGIVVPSYAYNGRACFAARGTTSEKPRQSGEALSTDIKDKNRTQGTGSPSSSSPSSSKRAPEYGQDSPPPPPPSMLAVLSSMIAGAGGAIVVAAIGCLAVFQMALSVSQHAGSIHKHSNQPQDISSLPPSQSDE